MHSRKYEHAARTCGVIFANSAFTADDTAATLGFPRERIVVAHPGIGDGFTADGPEVEADVLLAGVGVRPDTTLARDSGRARRHADHRWHADALHGHPHPAPARSVSRSPAAARPGAL